MSRLLTDDKLLLASGSPRRRQLMRAAGLQPRVEAVDVDESLIQGEGPAEMVVRLASAKARAARQRFSNRALILAADTTVVFDGRILGKPRDAAEAVRMLMDMRGQEHEVLTALALADTKQGEERVRLSRSRLQLREFSRSEAQAYADGGSPLDKAGAYGIQDDGFNPVDFEAFSDCFTNVMGLPLCTLADMLAELGWKAEMDLTQACFQYAPHALPAAQGAS